MKRVLILIATVSKKVPLPHIVKYGLCFIFKGKNLMVKSKIAISNITATLDIGEFIEYWLFMDGLYEGEWVKKIQHMTKDKVFIDIGANIGAYTLALCNTTKYIYAFEPEKENVHKLVHNLKTNSIKNVTTIQKAVYSHDGAAKLYKNETEKGWHSLIVQYAGGLEKIGVVTLDSFIEGNRISEVSVIKIDVEGAEYGVLHGAKKQLKNFTRLF